MDRVSPGAVTIVKPRYAAERQSSDVEVTIATRAMPTTYIAGSIEEAAGDVLEHLDDPDDDPVVPHWTRLTRFQRELVVQSLREHAARHMSRALESKIANQNAVAQGAFDAADAFQAAVIALDHEDVDGQHAMMPREPLRA